MSRSTDGNSEVLDGISSDIIENPKLSSQPASTSKSTESSTNPTCIIVLGMAGSGKTTFVTKLSEFLSQQNDVPYMINLDPAVYSFPYHATIDIRDTVKYKTVMQKFGLGPNGAIMTSLNLFTTKFASVLELLEKRKNETRFFVFDTPGQIEVFTWSASGTIITEALADAFRTVIVYVMDVSVSTSPVTFMSNMLYACSILYKSKLPFVIAMNKSDLIDPSFAMKWMSDFESFDLATDKEDTYAAGLSRSLGMILDEFYSVIKTVPLSAKTGHGFTEFMEAIRSAEEEYEKEYKPELQKLKEEQREIRMRKQREQIDKLKREVDEMALGIPQGKHTENKKNAVSIDLYQDEMLGDANEGDERDEEESFRRFLDTVGKNKAAVEAEKRKAGK